MTGEHRATLRLSARLIRRSRARSALVALLVAVPVLLGTFAVITLNTARLSPAEAAQRWLGPADAVAVVTRFHAVRGDAAVGRGPGYDGRPGLTYSAFHGTRRPAGVNLAALLPAGSHLALSPENLGSLTVSTAARTAVVGAVPVDLADPLTAQAFERVAGRAPASAGEVAVTQPLAERFALGVGSPLTVRGVGSVEVSAVVRDPRQLDAMAVVAPPATLGGLDRVTRHLDRVVWLVDTPGAAPDLRDRLAAAGVVYATRAQWSDPPPQVAASIPLDQQTIAILASIVLFGIAEIVLLAGTAFAVGARRQVRELGLLRVAGGDDDDVRRVVLGQGLLLGLVGAALGVGLGALAFALARSGLETIADRRFGAFDAPASPVLLVTLVGVVAGLLAAVVPARTSARLPVVDMLRTRFPVSSGGVRVPRWAWAALVLGPAVVVLAAAGWHHADPGRADPRQARWTMLLSLGAAITLAGIARSCPALLTRVGGLARRLPLALRLATRDAARHRHRTAPAVAAVATVLAGAVITLFVTSSTDLRSRQSYVPYQPVGTMLVSAHGDAGLQQALSVVRSAVDESDTVLVHPLGGRATVTVRSPGCRADRNPLDCAVGSVTAIDPAGLDVLLGHHDGAAAATLAAGGALVADPGVLGGSADSSEGTLHIDAGRGPRSLRSTTLDARVEALPRLGGFSPVLVSLDTARNAGWPAVEAEALVVPRALPSTATIDRLQHALGKDASVYAERGYESRYGLALLVLLLAGLVATLAGTSIAVALAMAEARADMATLAAVGASPGRRRVHAMAQAVTVGGLGAALGLGLGALVGIALLQGSRSYPFSLPVRWLALLVIAAPLLSAAVAGLVTRSRVDLTRRLA